MDNKKKDFVIDVAKDRTYQNQSDEYNKAFSGWRANKENPYAYHFTQDLREHSYIRGEGYLNKKPDVAEHLALYKCLSLLGIVMIAMLLIDVAGYSFIGQHANKASINVVSYSERHSPEGGITLTGAVAFSAVTVLRYLFPFLVFKFVTKIPIKVILPNKKTDGYLSANAISLMLMMVIMGKLSGFLLSRVLEYFKIDSVYTYMMASDDEVITIISIVLNCVAIPILCEIFFRGAILQTFRQFGDTFAILISSIVCALSFYDIGYIFYALWCSLLLGVFTVRTGSIKIPIVMNIIASSARYVIACLEMTGSESGRIVELVLGTAIMCLSLVAYVRIAQIKNFSLNIENAGTEITLGKKFKAMFSTGSFVIWIAGVVVMVFVCAKLMTI